MRLICHKKLDLELYSWGLKFEHRFTGKTLGFYSFEIASNSRTRMQSEAGLRNWRKKSFLDKENAIACLFN
jgi:hypothetical protein